MTVKYLESNFWALKSTRKSNFRDLKIIFDGFGDQLAHRHWWFACAIFIQNIQSQEFLFEYDIYFHVAYVSGFYHLYVWMAIKRRERTFHGGGISGLERIDFFLLRDAVGSPAFIGGNIITCNLWLLEEFYGQARLYKLNAKNFTLALNR